MRVADDLLFDGVPALGVGVGDLEAQRAGVDKLNLAGGIPALVVKKSLLVADQKLQIANLRSIDGGIVDFGVHPIGQRVPQTAGDGIRRSHPVFRAPRPARFNPRTTRGWILADHSDAPSQGTRSILNSEGSRCRRRSRLMLTVMPAAAITSAKQYLPNSPEAVAHFNEYSVNPGA